MAQVFNRIFEAVGVLAAFFCLSTSAQVVFRDLWSFPVTKPNPLYPATVLLEAPDGAFYGISNSGGDNYTGNGGTIFKVTKSGQLNVLYSFLDDTNGFGPTGGLTFGNDGNLYGVAGSGGAVPGIFGSGTVFRFSTNGVLKTLAWFHGTNGSGPNGPLVFGRDGYLYGITRNGGAFGMGTVFKASTNGVITTLHSFDGTNGSSPNWGLARGSNDIFYGTARYGGSNYTGSFTGNGTVFQITTNEDFTTLVYFVGTNGSSPYSRLIPGSDGNLWGTTRGGGSIGGGTVFKMSLDGTLVPVGNFAAWGPWGGATQGNDGNFYGTTAYSVQNGILTNGTIFKMTTNGDITTVAILTNTANLHPFTDLTLGSDGNLYGAMADVTASYAGGIYQLVNSPVVTATQADTNIILSWNTLSGAVYRVDYATSIANPNWNTLISNLTATGNAMSYTDAPGSDPQRFYRVLLSP